MISRKKAENEPVKNKTISVITPCFNEESGIVECYEAVRALFDNELHDYCREHIFCDNASSDSTFEILRKIAATDSNIKIIVNSRNFGSMRSTYNGVMHATGDAVLLFLPADLQDPPELIPEFVHLWEQGYEIVFGLRATREESLLLRTVRKSYYRILSRFSYVNYPPDAGDFQLVDRAVLLAMKRFHDAQPFMRMLTFETGFRSIGVPYRWRARKHGKSRNSLYHLIDEGLTGIVSFSTIPLRLVLFAGVAIAGLSFLFAILTVLLRIFDVEVGPRGTTTIVSAIFFFAGVQLTVLGLMGEYITTIFTQVRDRPLIIERETINFGAEAGEGA